MHGIIELLRSNPDITFAMIAMIIVTIEIACFMAGEDE